MNINLNFKSMRDFHPEQIAQNVPELRALLAMRNVLVHLYEWHCLLLNWIRSNTKGKSAAFLPEPYNWKTYPAMNVGFWKKHRETPYTAAESMLKKMHKEVMARREIGRASCRERV